MSKPGRTTYQLTLVDAAEPGDVEPILRLRAALKRLLRGYGLRCTRVVEVPTDAPPGTPPPAEPGHRG